MRWSANANHPSHKSSVKHQAERAAIDSIRYPKQMMFQMLQMFQWNHRVPSVPSTAWYLVGSATPPDSPWGARAASVVIATLRVTLWSPPLAMGHPFCSTIPCEPVRIGRAPKSSEGMEWTTGQQRGAESKQRSSSLVLFSDKQTLFRLGSVQHVQSIIYCISFQLSTSSCLEPTAISFAPSKRQKWPSPTNK